MHQSKQAIKYLDKASEVLTLVTVFLFPLFFTPMTANLFDIPKVVLLGILTSIILTLWVIRNMMAKSFRITITPFTLPLFLLTVVIIISSFSFSFAQMAQTFITSLSLPIFSFLF